MPSHNNIRDVKLQLAGEVRDALEGKVSDLIRLEMNQAIDDVVYSYHVKRYDRRKSTNGGLTSKEAFHKDVKKIGYNSRLEVENRAKANLSYERIEDSESQYLTPLIVYGHGGMGGKYSWGDEYPYSYVMPRNFIKETRDNLRMSGRHKVGMWMALEDKGYEVDM